MKALLIVLLAILPTSVHASFSARDTVARARIGTHSLPQRVTVEVAHHGRRSRQATSFERMTCRENPAAPRTLICDTRRIP